jgi:hypothetical protein
MRWSSMIGRHENKILPSAARYNYADIPISIFSVTLSIPLPIQARMFEGYLCQRALLVRIHANRLQSALSTNR